MTSTAARSSRSGAGKGVSSGRCARGATIAVSASTRASGPSSISRRRSRSSTELFDPATATVRGDLYCARHVLEHIPEPLEFLRRPAARGRRRRRDALPRGPGGRGCLRRRSQLRSHLPARLVLLRAPRSPACSAGPDSWSTASTTASAGSTCRWRRGRPTTPSAPVAAGGDRRVRRPRLGAPPRTLDRAARRGSHPPRRRPRARPRRPRSGAPGPRP